MIEKIEVKFLDRSDRLVGKMYHEVIAHQFFPKTKLFKSLDFKFEFASLENSEEGKNFTLYVIYKEIRE